MIFNNDLMNYIYHRQNEIKPLLNDVESFNHRSEYYKIKKYLDDFLFNKNIDNRFVVMPGLRGVGKTTIIFQLYNYLINTKKINSNNILYLPMDQVVKYFKTNLISVVDMFLDRIHKTTQLSLDEKIFIFVDESHFDKDWAISGKILYDNTKNIFLIFTGSSAIDLEINTDVARRISKESIYPNNFRDYLLLKHDIKTDYRFSNVLENIVYFGEEKYIEEGIKLEEKVQHQLSKLNNNLKIEFREFLKAYGFPLALNSKESDTYKKIFSIVNKIIHNDIYSIKAFNTPTIDNIERTILYLGLQRPGSVSNNKIANYLSISPKLVNEILNALEKTQLIFSIKPYGGAGKTIKKSWNYYFLSPSIKTAINHEIGRFNFNNEKCIGSLSENYVASSLFKMMKTRFRFMGLFYPPDKKGTDFIIRTKLDDLVPIEVGIGNKTKNQVVKTMNSYDADYGILISNKYFSITKTKNIIHIPLTSFGFI